MGQVDYGTGTTIPIPRSRYEANGYKPDFDKLPSEAEYRAAEDKKEDDAKRPYSRLMGVDEVATLKTPGAAWVDQAITGLKGVRAATRIAGTKSIARTPQLPGEQQRA